MELSTKRRIAFLLPYPESKAPSQRFRVEMYFPHLKNYYIDKYYFLNTKTNNVLYKEGKWFNKSLGVILGFFRRIYSIPFLAKCDYVFIHREATPIGPPIIEYIIAKILRKKIIFDFDDAIWLSNTSKENGIIKYLKWHSKTKNICAWAYKVAVGNEYLGRYAKKYAKDVYTIPTIVDTDRHIRNSDKSTSDNKITIGWTGSFSTLKYLDIILPILQEIEKDFDFNFLVIANKNPQLELRNFSFIKWSEKTEIDDLAKIDIGVMPLLDNKWCQGKCGFKAIQYMSLGIPALVSPVGVNTKIVDHGLNGLICNTAKDWKKNLVLLLTDDNIRKKMSVAARQKIEGKYSLNSTKEEFLNLFT